MKNTYAMALAIVALVIIIGGVFAYQSLSTPAASPSPSVTPTATPTVAPTQTPASSTSPTPTVTSTPVATVTPNPTGTTTPAPTASPTAAPTLTPTVAPTPTPTPVATPSPASLTGSGATFPAPFLNLTIVTYTTQIRPNLQINYQGGGSGAGISGLTAKTVDFACSDAALTASQTAALSSQAVTIPETIGAITIAYNLPGISNGQLRLTGDILSKIYLGTITNWNDPAITTLNPSLTLPSRSIVTVHRSEGSGTTNWFTKYLSLVNPTWNSTVGNGNSVQWPGGIGSSGNSGVASSVNSTQYAIGYVELAYALQNGMTVAALQNPAGNYVTPSLASTTAAASSLPKSGLPSGTGDWTGVNILNAPGAQAYPICNPSYMMVYKELNTVSGMTLDKATQLVQYIWYVVHGGQQLAPTLQYASLPSNIVTLDEATIRSITFNGQSLNVG
jgi:phosphate transport system substrate-binding protein